MEFSISGPGILLRIPTGIPFLGDILITETLAVSWLVMLLVTGACIWMTRGLQVENISKKQVLAEFWWSRPADWLRITGEAGMNG